MAATVRTSAAASQREELADVRPRPAKAGLAPQGGASRLRELAAEAIRATSGNARAAAIDLGIHEAHLSRLLKDGSIRVEQLEALGPAFAAKLGAELLERYGPLASPQQRVREAVRDIRRRCDEIDQFLEFVK